MKTINKILFSLFYMLFLNLSGYSQNLFVDDFNYPPRDSLQGYGGWFLTAEISPYKIRVVSPGLTYTGYVGSGIGNTAFIYNQPNGQVVLHNFTTQSSGSVYMAYMMRVDSVGVNTTQGYNIGLDAAGGSTNFNTITYLRRVTSNSFNIGILKSGGAIRYKNAVYSTNTTYLIVVKYTFVGGGTTNDSAKIFILSSGVPSTEPPEPDTFTVSGTDVVNNGQVFLSNSFAQDSAFVGTTVKFDGIRIGTSWQGAIMTSVNPISNEVPESYRLYQNYPNPFNPTTKIRFDVPSSPLYERGVGGFIILRIYDILGHEIATLVNENLNPGTYEVEWNAAISSSGLYYYKLTAGEFSVSKKMMLIK